MICGVLGTSYNLNMKRYLLLILIILAFLSAAISLSVYTVLAHGGVEDGHADTPVSQASGSNQRIVVGIIFGVIVVSSAIFFIAKKKQG